MNPTDSNYPIQPDHIDASRHLFNALDHYETEVSAGYVIRMCQERGEGWAPFTGEQIEAYYQRAGHKDGFWFNRLVSHGWLTKDGDTYQVTHKFVTRCFNASPACGQCVGASRQRTNGGKP